MEVSSEKTVEELLEENARLRQALEEANRRETVLSAQRDALANFLPAGISFLDRDLCYVYINQLLAARNGLTPEQHVGRSLSQVLSLLLAQVESGCRQVLEQGEALVQQQGGDGNWHWQVSYFPVRTKTGQVIGVGIMVEDISEQKRNEEKIFNLNKDLERRINELQTLFDVIPIGIAIADDPECTRIRVNPAYARLLDLTPDQNASKSAPPEERPSYKVCQNGRELAPEELPMQYAAAHGQEVLDMEAEYVFESGQVLKVLGYAAPIRGEGGEILGSVGACLDITERKRVEEAQYFLAEASMLLASSLDYETTLPGLAMMAVPNLADWCAIDVMGMDGSLKRLALEYSNPAKAEAAETLKQKFPFNLDAPLGVPQALRSGQSEFYPWVTPEIVANYAQSPEHLELLQEMGFTSVIVAPMVARGRTIGAISLFYGESQRHYTRADLVLLEDLTRRAALAVDNAQLYRQAQEAIERQQELDRLKDQFFSIASHELRTPLTSIKGYTQLLERHQAKRRGALPAQNNPEIEREARILNSISHQANRMDQLIKEMLDISRLQTGKFELKLDSTKDFVALVRRTVEQQQVATPSHPIIFQSEHEMICGTFDEARMEQVLNNLLSNASKYSPEGKPITVGIELQTGEGNISAQETETGDSPAQFASELVCWVRDEGYGISKSDQARIFERFYRGLNRESKHVDGLGLGLYISHEIVVRHGGRMWLESTPGVGSTFYFSLPLA